MGTEIERKFLVVGDDWRGQGESSRIAQAYICRETDRSVRVRRRGDQAWLTVKGKSQGATRLEFEYEIPLEDAKGLFELCPKPWIDKTRTNIARDGVVWEVDEFYGDNEGLVVAEVELTHEDQEIVKPDWLGDEVTGDPRYLNANLVAHPFNRW